MRKRLRKKLEKQWDSIGTLMLIPYFTDESISKLVQKLRALTVKLDGYCTF